MGKSRSVAIILLQNHNFVCPKCRNALICFHRNQNETIKPSFYFGCNTHDSSFCSISVNVPPFKSFTNFCLCFKVERESMGNFTTPFKHTPIEWLSHRKVRAGIYEMCAAHCTFPLSHGQKLLWSAVWITRAMFYLKCWQNTKNKEISNMLSHEISS